MTGITRELWELRYKVVCDLPMTEKEVKRYMEYLDGNREYEFYDKHMDAMKTKVKGFKLQSKWMNEGRSNMDRGIDMAKEMLELLRDKHIESVDLSTRNNDDGTMTTRIDVIHIKKKLAQL